MSEQPDNAQRTEEPTQKRLDDARKKGDAPKSQEVVAALMLAAGALALWLLAGPISTGIATTGSLFIGQPHNFLVDPQALQLLFSSLAAKLGLVLAGAALLFVAAAITANTVQAKPVFTTERMKPSLQKISPISGAKRIFGPSGLFNFAKGVGKIFIVGSILGMALWPDRDLLANAVYANGAGLLHMMQMLTMKLVGLTILAMLVIAGLDLGFQRYSWKKRLRMTKEEVRRELKEAEGDPQIKGRQRQLRDARMRQRMLVAVEDATVLIMNPTHYAVALNYETGSADAPVCVAKGLDELALRMREVARENNVPVVENPPLARALHASVDVDDEIPLEHYQAVANVIGFIMKKAAEQRRI